MIQKEKLPFWARWLVHVMRFAIISVAWYLSALLIWPRTDYIASQFFHIKPLESGIDSIVILTLIGSPFLAAYMMHCLLTICGWMEDFRDIQR